MRAVALAALVAAIAGCSSTGRTGESGDGAAHYDAGSWMAPRDAASPDGAGPPPAQDAGVYADAQPGLAGEYDSRGDPATAFETCFNDLDDDGNGAGDCADTSCRANVPACCVGASDAACCVEGASAPLAIGGCAGTVDGCPALLEMAEPFGSPRPEVGAHGSDLEGATLVPRGASTDSGLVLRDVLDPRASSVRIEARIAGDHEGHDAGPDVIAVGLVEAAGAASITHAWPVVAFMISGNRGEVSLLLAGEIVQRWPLVSGFHDYALTVRPSGRVELTRGGVTLGSSALSITAPVRPIVYGRTFNPSPDSPDPVRVESLSVRIDACDVPSALGDGAVIFPGADPSWDTVRRVASPSVARWVDGLGETHERMALEIDGAIHLASADGGAWALSSALDAPALVGEASWAERLGDPALRWNGATLELWFTGYQGSTGTVARVLAPEGTETFAWGDVEPLFVPDAGESFAQPAPFSAGARYVVLRVRDAGGGDALVLYREEATGWAPVQPLRAASGALGAFDRDEVASPSVVAGSVYRLYFAGRRGLRWSIGTLISPDGVTWIEPHGGSLVRSASGAGFDALGVSDPAPVIDGDTVRLFYTGLDGERARIGLASGTAPPR